LRDWVQQAAQLIKRHEGFRKYPYRDTMGHLTIGYGHNLDALGITRKQAEVIFRDDLRRAIDMARSVCQAHGIAFAELPAPAKVALTDMAFNLGAKLYEFKHMLSAIAEGNWEQAAEEALDSVWAKQVGRRAEDVAELLRSCASDGATQGLEEEE